MAAIFTGCGKTTASVETVTEAETKAVVKEETTQAPTEAPTEAETEAVTEAETEAVTETEVVVEAPVEVVAEPVAESATEAVTEASVSSAQVASYYGKISDATSSTVTLNADGTVSSPSGTYSSVDAYNEATGHTEGNDPEHLTKGGYLYGDKKTAFLVANQIQTLKGSGYQHNIDNYGITDEDLAAYNITWIK
jgi:predicted Zn-dependent protease